MIRHDCTQGSPEWYALRRGRPTASEFHRILTPTGKPSTQDRTYALRLVAEKLLGRDFGADSRLEWMERGKELEPQAAAAYEFDTDAGTERVGFVTTDDGRIGASPDRFVGKAGMLEIKCPAPHTHLGYLLDGFDNDYRPQVQGQLWIAEREWSDWMSYSPEMPPVIIRTHRDEKYIGLLREALRAFCGLLADIEGRALQLGVMPLVADPAPERPLQKMLRGEIWG